MGSTVLIVDDHAGFGAGARALLEADGFRVLGEAENGEAGIETARRPGPASGGSTAGAASATSSS